MNLNSNSSIAPELMYEVDSLYVSTEMILSGQFRDFPIDGLLLEACLLHFRVVWDFFYRPKKEGSDVVVGDFIPTWNKGVPPTRLAVIRKWLNVMLAHLTTRRADPTFKIGEITMADINEIREHTRTMFDAFVKDLPEEGRRALVNPHARKFAQYQTLKASCTS